MAKKKTSQSVRKSSVGKKGTGQTKKAAVKKKAVKKKAVKKKVARKKAAGKSPKKSPASKTTDSPTKPSRTERKTNSKASSVKHISMKSFPIVGMGASAGGLEALESFFKAMPADSGCAFVLVVHLDPTHISIMPELLQKRTKMPVCQVKDGIQIQPNHVYVIPPNKDLTILHGTLHLMELSQPRGVNLPIDTFFRSLAQDQERNAVCIILSGTGTDGTLGVKAIKGEVGMVMVQDEDSAKYEGMPRSAISTGLVDYVLPPKDMPQQLIKYTQHATQKAAPRIAPIEGPVPSALQKIFVVLRARTNHDFSLYKKNTICRRIERRMNVHQIDDIAEYVRYLQESDREAGILFKELLIGVTNFFRDAEGFEVLPSYWRTSPKIMRCESGSRGAQAAKKLIAWPSCCTSAWNNLGGITTSRFLEPTSTKTPLPWPEAVFIQRASWQMLHPNGLNVTSSRRTVATIELRNRFGKCWCMHLRTSSKTRPSRNWICSVAAIC